MNEIHNSTDVSAGDKIRVHGLNAGAYAVQSVDPFKMVMTNGQTIHFKSINRFFKEEK